MASTYTRTTLTLPTDLLAQVDQAIREGKAISRDAYVATLLRRAFADADAAAIDTAFAAMTEDAEYQDEAVALSEEFVAEEWRILCSLEDKA
jgi:metal-responsive CopG/Arc/MetJ family transcriptional regulator